jgi:hypothetical protein
MKGGGCIQYLSHLIIAICMCFIIKRENEKAKERISKVGFTIKLPKIYIWIGLIDIIIFWALFTLMLFYPNDTDTVWVGVCFIAFIALGVVLILVQINWQIVVCNEYFIYTTVFGRSYYIYYSDVKNVKLTQNVLIIKTTEKTFYADSKAIGLETIIGKFIDGGIYLE